MQASDLKLMGVRSDLAERFAGPLTNAMDEFGITTRERKAAFMAQVLHESGLLKWVVEIWGPTPAQVRYEGRKDLGNTQPGDGKRFMGRGLLQTTGRENYRRTGEALGVDLLSNPQQLAEPVLAARSAGWFWKEHGLNELADDGDQVKICKRINGGLNGLEDRMRLYKLACGVFDVNPT